MVGAARDLDDLVQLLHASENDETMTNRQELQLIFNLFSEKPRISVSVKQVLYVLHPPRNYNKHLSYR